MNLDQRIFPAKALLFGEYTVLSGSGAFAIPIYRWKAGWQQSGERSAVTEEFISYLSQRVKKMQTRLDLDAARKELKRGWRLTSDIPQGKGLGSSAALTAAFYHRYAVDAIRDLKVLQEDLATIEAFFHGRSSGMDPLVSYEQVPIWRNAEGKIVREKLPPLVDRLWLIDSGLQRDTQALVRWYQECLKEHHFASRMKILADLHDRAIESLVAGKSVVSLVKEIGQMQLRDMRPLVPPQIAKIWQEINDDFGSSGLKFCGAAGGGFFLLFTRDLSLPNLYGLSHCQLKVVTNPAK